MSKRTLILILILIIVTAGLVTIAFLPQKNIITPPVPVRKPITAPPAQTSLTIAHNPTSVSTTSALPLYELPIDISTGGNKVTAVQLELSYDPKVLTNVDIKPGSFFKNPLVLLKKIDTQNGRISYALAIQPGQKGVSGNSTVAVITFSSNGQTGKTTTINILSKSLATAQGTDKSVLKFGLGTTFTLGNPPLSPSSASPVSPVQAPPGTSSAY